MINNNASKHKQNIESARVIVINHILNRIKDSKCQNYKETKEIIDLYKELKSITGEDQWVSNNKNGKR